LRRLACSSFLSLLTCLWPQPGLPLEFPKDEPDIDRLMQGEVFIYKLHPENASGWGYKLVYAVAAPPKAYWNFKTDFENDFVLTNRLIADHRLVARQGNVAVTEIIHTDKPGVWFRWRTALSPKTRRLDFELVNPEECGQRFHHGHIQLEPLGGFTKVTQVAYFDFLGATFWVHSPLRGGMRANLAYTAHWEQETVARLIDRYR